MFDERKPMDPKAMLAFVLLIAIVLLLPKYWEAIGYQKPRTPRPVPADTTTVAATQNDAAAPQPAASTPVEPQQSPTVAETNAPAFAVDSSLKEATITIETKYYRALLSTRGARLKQLILKDYKYTDAARRNQNIVILDTTDQAGPRFRFFQGKLDWSNTLFRADVPAVNIRNNDSAAVHLTARTRAGQELTITYVFYGNHHDFSLAVELPEPWLDGVEREYDFGWEGGLWPTEPDPAGDNQQFAAVALMGEDLETISKVDQKKPRTRLGGLTHWAAVRTKYFLCATIPRSRPAEGLLVTAHERPFRFEGKTIPLKDFSASLHFTLAPGQPLQDRFTVYVGPVEYGLLKSYGVGLEGLVQLGWRWVVRPFALLILWLFKFMHGFVPNYGVVIILFSLLIKVIFHPLTKKSMRSMRRMQALQPRMEKLRERFKDDSQRLNQEMMKMYREAGINPVSGCLPLLPQMPIFYGLFQVFRTTIELRGAYFVGWLTDLSQKDPYYILPIIMTISFFLQQRLSSKDPKQKTLTYVLPLVFGFMFKNFPAGLTLYWTMYNIFSVVEQTWLIEHPEETTDDQAAVGSGRVVTGHTGRSAGRR